MIVASSCALVPVGGVTVTVCVAASPASGAVLVASPARLAAGTLSATSASAGTNRRRGSDLELIGSFVPEQVVEEHSASFAFRS